MSMKGKKPDGDKPLGVSRGKKKKKKASVKDQLRSLQRVLDKVC